MWSTSSTSGSTRSGRRALVTANSASNMFLGFVRDFRTFNIITKRLSGCVALTGKSVVINDNYTLWVIYEVSSDDTWYFALFCNSISSTRTTNCMKVLNNQIKHKLVVEVSRVFSGGTLTRACICTYASEATSKLTVLKNFRMFFEENSLPHWAWDGLWEILTRFFIFVLIFCSKRKEVELVVIGTCNSSKEEDGLST